MLRKRNKFLEDSLNTYKKKVKILQQHKRRKKKKIAEMKHVLKDLQQRNYLESEYCTMLHNISQTSLSILRRQKSKSANEKSSGQYDASLRAFAITLNFLSPRAYNFVRDTFDTCLPHPRTLCKWYSTVNAAPGFSTEALSALHNIAEKKVCALMFDCMSIRKNLEWSGSCWHGTVNNCAEN